MITQNRKYLLFTLIILLPIILLLRSPSSTFPPNFLPSSSSGANAKGKPDPSLAHQSNATSFEHSGILDESLEGAPKLAQVSMQYGGNFDLLYERGLRTHVKYGERWGYPTHFLRQDIVGKGDGGGMGMYNKLLYLLTIMVNEQTKPFGKRAEWLAWFDADSVLINDQVPWTVFLPPTENELFRDINLLVSKDWIGFNAGVFLIRVCEWSIAAITDAIALPRLRPEIDLPFNEQDAFKWVFNQPENKRHRVYQPRHWWNQYDEYYANMGEKVMKGCIVVHFPGMGGARPDRMGWWLDQVDNHPEGVSVPLSNTSYPSEVEAYWSRIRSAAEMLKRTEDYKNTLKEENYEVYVAEGGKIPDSLGKAEAELHEIIEEEAYDKQRLREAVLKLDKAVRGAKKDVVEIQEKKQREEEEKRKKDEEERKRLEEERAKKAEEAKKKAEEEKKKKEEEEKAKEEKAREETARKAKMMQKQAEGGDGDGDDEADDGDAPASKKKKPTDDDGQSDPDDSKDRKAGKGKKPGKSTDAADEGDEDGEDTADEKLKEERKKQKAAKEGTEPEKP